MAYVKKSDVDHIIKRFMRCATEEAQLPRIPVNAHERGLAWGQAYGIYGTLNSLKLVSQETAAELEAVLFSRKEDKPCKSNASP